MRPEVAPPDALTLLYLDDHLAVVDKPPGLLVHRGWDRDRHVVMTVLRDQLGRHVYPVHRLDRQTSGALAFALSPEAARALGAQFEAGAVDKRYLALVRGVTPEAGLVDHPVPKDEDGPRVPARTAFVRRFVFERFSLVEARPETGRLHQIRRHMKHLSHPLVGDVRYGKGDINRLFRQRFGLHRLALHAAWLSLAHPLTGARLDVQAPLAPDLRAVLEAVGAPHEAWATPAPQEQVAPSEG